MSYIQNNLQAGEEIKYKADIHWYIFAYPVILLLLSAFSFLPHKPDYSIMSAYFYCCQDYSN